MRKLKLYNFDKTSSLDLNDKKYLVDEITGFGTGYKLVGEDKLIHDIELEFEPITLRINFGINKNAYNCYNEFMNFIISNGKNKLILEYDYSSDFDAMPRYCDIYLQSAPKTQKTIYNIISETFRFKRLTPWYKTEAIIAPGNGTPFQLEIDNEHFMPIALILETTNDSGTITFLLEKDEIEIGRIVIELKNGYSLKIDSETKKAIFFNAVSEISAYDNIDHTYNSFFLVNNGKYLFKESSGANIKIRYKKWVAD